MTSVSTPPWVSSTRLLIWGVLLTLVSVLGTVVWLILVVRANTFPMVDLSVYRAGGRAVVDGRDLYTMKAPGTGLPFTYPPFAALSFVPLAVIGVGLGQILFTGVTLLALARVVWLVAGRALPSTLAPSTSRAVHFFAAAALGALALGLEPLAATLSFGQINVVLLWLIVEDLLGAVPARWRGVLVGVAAGLKLTPGLFIVYLLLVGRPRAAARALAGLAVTVALGFAVLPGESWRYWTGIAYDARRVGGVAYAGNQSIDAVLIRLSSIEGAKVAWLIVALVVTVLALLVARAASRSGREMLAVTVVGVTTLLASPVAWNHHWVWVVLVVAVLAADLLAGAGARGLTATVLVLVVVVFTSRIIWQVPARNDVEYHWHGWQLLAGNAYALCGLVVLGYAAWTVRQEFWPRRRVR